MALFNEILAARFNNGLRRILAMKGQAPAPQIGGDIVADITLESDRAEWSYLKAEILACGFGSSAALAANRSIVSFQNPSGSGVLAVIEEFECSDLVANNYVSMRRYDGTLANTGVVAVLPRDSRASSQSSPIPVCVISANVAAVGAVGGTQFDQIAMGPGAVAGMGVGSRKKEYVLGPGTGLRFIPGIDNVDLTISFRWRERAIEPSEV